MFDDEVIVGFRSHRLEVWGLSNRRLQVVDVVSLRAVDFVDSPSAIFIVDETPLVAVTEGDDSSVVLLFEESEGFVNDFVEVLSRSGVNHFGFGATSVKTEGGNCGIHRR